MKDFLKKIFNVHETIGKICSSLCIVAAIAAIIGLITGTTRIATKDDVVKTNYFLNETVNIHDENYSLIITNAKSSTEITYLDKELKEIKLDGNFILVSIEIYQNKLSTLKNHNLDCNDFKLKDHTGVYVPLNDIMGAVGWDALDVHIDEQNGGRVMSSTEFSTVNLYKDYNYINKEIMPGEIFKTTLIFKMDTAIDPLTELIVLEVDFYIGSSNYKKGSDIILLNRPENLKTEN